MDCLGLFPCLRSFPVLMIETFSWLGKRSLQWVETWPSPRQLKPELYLQLIRSLFGQWLEQQLGQQLVVRCKRSPSAPRSDKALPWTSKGAD